MTQNEKIKLIVKALDSKKADGIQAIKISDLTIHQHIVKNRPFCNFIFIRLF